MALFAEVAGGETAGNRGPGGQLAQKGGDGEEAEEEANEMMDDRQVIHFLLMFLRLKA